jgi:SPP1 family phage portal protein
MQCIPIWNECDNDDLDAFIRYYGVSVDVGNKTVELKRIEYWTAIDVTYYIETKEGSNKFVLDNSYEINPKKHYQLIDMVNGNIIEANGISWGKVPFIPLWWNDEHQNQLYTIKQWIDIYDITCSDFANNIDDFQDVYWILKNYNGQNLDEFMAEVKRSKTIKVGGDGDASAQTIQIPVEARNTFLEIANKNIYKFGQGFDNNATGDGNITNVVIRSRYADLDLKANEFETQLEEWFEDILYFVNEWHKLNGTEIYEDIDLILDRSMIINELEVMDMVSKQKGIVSDVTMLENHPLVDNVDEELERLDEQAKANPVSLDTVLINDSTTDQEDDEQNNDMGGN